MPANGRFLLDTNIVIALFEGDESVIANLDLASEVFVPAIVLGELFFGAAKSGRPIENAAKVDRFAGQLTHRDVTAAAFARGLGLRAMIA